MGWAQPKWDRDQLVLFSRSLDDAIPFNHKVRLVDHVLQRVDWRPWEATCHQRPGQPAIHPRIPASVLLYGLMCRILSSRRLEEALEMRMDFRWLVHGTSIDHSTLSEFRRKHPDQLKNLFVQIVLVAREMNLVGFQHVAFDGTRVRANNRRTGTRTPEQLRKSKQQLEEEFDRLYGEAAAQDTREDEGFGGGTPSNEPPSEADREQQRRKLARSIAQVDAALAELERIENSSESIPARLPITDPESRFTKNKDGGFAPNYTPMATVDDTSGLIVDVDVIPQSNESGELLNSLNRVQEDYQLASPVPGVAADGLNATTENQRACEEPGVVAYAPVPGAHVGDNPAVRENLREPVPADQVDKLPMRTVKIDGRAVERFDKQAFVYAPVNDVYRCPAGQELSFSSTYTTTDCGRTLTRQEWRWAAIAFNLLQMTSHLRQGVPP